MATGQLLTKDGVVEFELSQAELDQQVIDADKAVVKQAARATEKARRLSITDDTSRQEYLTQLKTATADQIETFVRNRINVDSVTDLPSAKQAMKRLETGMVNIMKLLALVVRG